VAYRLTGQIFRGLLTGTPAFRRWLATVRFAHQALRIVLQGHIHAVRDAEARLERLTRQIKEPLPSWPMAPIVAALQATREVAPVVAVTVVAEIGEGRRFAIVRQLMAYLGLVPSERSSGTSVRGARNVLARRVLIEGRRTYGMPA
jgi:transposase